MKRLRIFGASVLLLVLFGVAASLYSHISRIAYYDFPFAKVDIDGAGGTGCGTSISPRRTMMN